MKTMPLTPAECLVRRWNATYPPGTPVTVTHETGQKFDAIAAFAFISGDDKSPHGLASVAIQPQGGTRVCFPLRSVEHRAVAAPASEQAMRALGMPPLSELDPAPLLDLRTMLEERMTSGLRLILHPCGTPVLPEEWDGRWLTIPHASAGYIAKLTAPPTQEQTEHIERHIAEYHGLPPVIWFNGLPWTAPDNRRIVGQFHGHPVYEGLDGKTHPANEAGWYVQFTFAHRFIPGTATLCRNR